MIRLVFPLNLPFDLFLLLLLVEHTVQHLIHTALSLDITLSWPTYQRPTNVPIN